LHECLFRIRRIWHFRDSATATSHERPRSGAHFQCGTAFASMPSRAGPGTRGQKEENIMLQNSAIDFPERLFEVEFVVVGTATRSTARRTIKVLASTLKGARRVCKSRYMNGMIIAARPCEEQAFGCLPG
jgi:hypothetical protein